MIATTTPAPAPTDTPPVPPLEYTWAEEGFAIISATPDHEAAHPLADTLSKAHVEQFAVAAAKAHDLPEEKEVRRLVEQLADADAKLAAAKARAAKDQELAMRALGAGNDPATHEQAAKDARHDVEVFTARIAHLKKLLAPARHKATLALNAARDAAWRKVIGEMDASRAKVLHKAAPALGPLLTELLAIDEASAALYDATDGGPPRSVRRLFELDAGD